MRLPVEMEALQKLRKTLEGEFLTSALRFETLWLNDLTSKFGKKRDAVFSVFVPLTFSLGFFLSWKIFLSLLFLLTFFLSHYHALSLLPYVSLCRSFSCLCLHFRALAVTPFSKVCLWKHRESHPTEPLRPSRSVGNVNRLLAADGFTSTRPVNHISSQ